MLDESFNQDPPESIEPHQIERQEFVGAPTEYADAAEVPEVVSIVAKVITGGLLSWTVLAAVLTVLALSCAICAFLSYAAGVVLR
jgi:hypothetical protein